MFLSIKEITMVNHSDILIKVVGMSLSEDRFEEMGLLVKVISHEMGNALNVLEGGLQVQDRMGEAFYADSEMVELFVEGVVRGQNELKLIKDFIDQVSKGSDLDRSSVMLNKLVSFLNVSGIDMKAFEIVGDLKLSVTSNLYGLSLIVLNLLRNAVEAKNSRVESTSLS